MNPDIKAQWVAALRSGEYKQGQRALSHSGRYCCLGVLCELAVKAGAIERVTRTDGTYLYGSGENGWLLPSEVVDWAGVGSGNPRANGHELFAYNDGVAGVRRHTFTEIADLIEEHL